jgi:flavodoxin
MKTLIVYVSYHHNNTEKVARAIGEPLDATLVNPDSRVDVSAYDLLGFGSGIYFARHHESLLSYVKRLPTLKKQGFIFSTCGIGLVRMFHRPLKRALCEKECTIVGEFSCKGLDTVGPLKYIGGINKKRPNNKDLENARMFAETLKKCTSQELLE